LSSALDVTLTLIWALPLVGSISLATMHRFSETFLARLVAVMLSGWILLVVGTSLTWLAQGMGVWRTSGENFWIIDYRLQFDGVSAVFLMVTALCGTAVLRFSRVYLHKEPGFARFFALVHLLMGGMCTLALADAMPVFFAGWEFVGLASFFLVAFYRMREASVWNALKIFMIYRVGDLGLLVAGVAVHLISSGDTAYTLSSLPHVDADVWGTRPVLFSLLGLGIIIAAAAKSAQVPFSFWLSRAMEGPTPSSAIFYGALAVHAGVLLLIRTHAVWSDVVWLQGLVITIGLTTVLVSTVCGRVQSSIKAQLAYASTVHVGLMFVEIGLGFTNFALWHFVTHALFRSFQILLSPSVITSFMQLQGRPGHVTKFSSWSIESLLPQKIHASLWTFGIQDGYQEIFWERCVVRPARRLLESRLLWIIVLMHVVVTALWSLEPLYWGASLLVLLQALLALDACFEVRAHRYVTTKVALSFLFGAAAASLMGHSSRPLFLWALTVGPFWMALAGVTIWGMRAGHLQPLAAGFGGGFETFPRMSWLIVFLTLGLLGYPPFPGFLAEDVMLEVMVHHVTPLSPIFGLAVALCGVAMFRALALSCFGAARN
jgi:NADH-quinone oxidoreductase subunit L